MTTYVQFQSQAEANAVIAALQSQLDRGEAQPTVAIPDASIQTEEDKETWRS